MTHRWRAWARRVIQLILTLGVTWLVVSRVGVSLEDVASLGSAVPDPSGLVLFGSAAVLLLGFGISGWLWSVMVSELGEDRPGLWGALRIVFTANLGRYLPGRLWQIAGLAVLAGRNGMSRTVAGIAGVLGQAFALAAVAVLASPALIARGGGEGRAWAVALGVLALFVVLASIPALVEAGLRIAVRMARLSSGPARPVARLFGVRWLAWYLMNWTVYGVAFVLFVRGLGFSAGWLELVSAFAAAYLLGYVAVFAPAGLGVREGFLIVFLTPQLASAAVGVALLTRVWMTLVELVPAGGFAIWEVSRSTGSSAGARPQLEEP